MDQELSSRTIFIFDRSRACLDTKSGHFVEADLKITSPVEIPSTLITKSLYTCSVEAIVEYSRIVWDLFPNGEKLLLFISCSPNYTCTLNKWDKTQQNCETLLNSLMKLAQDSQTSYRCQQQQDDDSSKSFLLDGFKNALAQLSSSVRRSQKYNSKSTSVSGRIIILTYTNDENVIASFRNESLEEFETYNQKTKTPINNLDVILINNYPNHSNIPVIKDDSNQKLSKQFKFSVYSIESCLVLASRLSCMAFEHYDLASTTVCNIPMKEEQNSGSSAAYDVEIIHSRKAHSEFIEYSPLTDIDSLHQDVNRDKQVYKTLKLKWTTPSSKNNILDSNHSIGAYRITAVDVTSRPTSCLINFLHSGKTVLLEIPKKSTTHMLRCHNGELYIHVLAANRSLMEDLPSISEGVGGRIVDYRINDFAEIMKRNHLKLCNKNVDGINLMLANDIILQKQTLYWPISFSLTIFFNVRDHFNQFYQLITKDQLTEQECNDLKNVIYQIYSFESKNFNLSIPNNIIRCKNLKRNDLFRILWNEIGHILRCYNQTPQHKKILQCHVDLNLNNSNYLLPAITFPSIGDLKRFKSEQDSMESMIANENVNFEQIKNSVRNLKDIYIGQFMAKRKKPDFTEKICKKSNDKESKS